MKNKKIFNLKYANINPPIFEEAEGGISGVEGLPSNSSSFEDGGEPVNMSDLEGPNLLENDGDQLEINNREDMHDFLINSFQDSEGDPEKALDYSWNKIVKIMGDSDVSSQVKDGLQRFFSMDESDMKEDEGMSLSNDIWNIYSSAVGPDIEPTMVHESSNLINRIILSSRESIERISNYICENVINKKEDGSLQKTAQHKSMDNIFYYGPDSVSISPFTNDIQSGIHRVEQNKGFGLSLDDIKDIDYEAIWRQNVMDKYTQPYRDEQGNYVGGLINKRFEVNRNIDPINNMQLPPGVRRRPYIPELGSTEARMEVARGNKDKLNDPFSFSKLELGFDKKKRAE
jgi:hypothetical protein